MKGSRATRLKIGLLGCGRIAGYAHLPLLREIRGGVLGAAADPDPLARERARTLTGVEVHEQSEELLRRADIDAVVICVPTSLHARLAVAAAEAGKHFYLEKPIAVTSEDARRVVEAARRAGVKTAIGFNRRLHPLYEQARTMLRAGRIGRVRAVQTAACEPLAPEALSQWRRSRATGGGVLLELASHHFDALRWFLEDEIQEVAAVLSSERTEHDHASVRLSMGSGVEVQSLFSFRAGYADFLEFFGEQGTLRVDRHRPNLELRVARRRGYGLRRAWVRPSADAATWRATRPLLRVREPSYGRSLEAFIELIEGQAGRLASLDDGVRSLEAILAAEISALPGPERATVSVPDGAAHVPRAEPMEQSSADHAVATRMPR